MSARSPATDRDPFQLERLAEELEIRELNPHVGLDSPSHDLPILVPLSHSNPYITAPTFNVEEFLLSRSHTSLPDLRTELRDYLGMLKEELVKLINDDYEAFISLSTDLRGEGARLERLKFPLGMLKSEILVSKGELQVIQDAIQEKLKKRAILREEKALLHLLLKISESVTRLESLLLIAAPVQDSASSPELTDTKMPSHLHNQEHDDVDDRARANRAKHLARVAAEYTQLLYHVSKARESSCVYVDEIQWRIDRIQSTLSSDLDHLFATTLLALTSGASKGKEKVVIGSTTEGEKAKLTADLTECLRTYDLLGLWRDAEDVVRREIVRDFVKKTIYSGALTAPHSPLMPHTPLPSFPDDPFPRTHIPSASHLTPGTTTAPNIHPNPPRTPYTPFTAFASKQNPFALSQASALGAAHLLDEAEDALARVYNQVLRFVERDLKRIMAIGEKVCLRSGAGEKAKDLNRVLGQGKEKENGVAGKEKGGQGGFEMLANVIWAEFGRAIMDEMGSSVFAAGRPDEFRMHYETTQAFIRALEFLAPSVHAIEAMRSHTVYVIFQRRWQLSVYFQLRWKEIIGKLEDVLVSTSIEPAIGRNVEPFVTSQASAVWLSISTCWSADVFIPPLGHRFWKLTLQLLSRYKTWLDASLPAFEPGPKVALALATEKTAASSSHTRAATPASSSEAVSAESNAADDILLRRFAAAMVDIKAMHCQILDFFRGEIDVMLPDTPEEDGKTAEDALQRQLSSLGCMVLPMSTQITNILTRRACDALQPVRSILSQFRAMSNKRTPTEASYFVPSIMRPVRNFFGAGVDDAPGNRLKGEMMKSCATEVFEGACHRYIYYITNMKKTEESLRRLKKGQKATFSLFGGSNTAKDTDHRDEERTRTQMILDVNAFSKDAESLEVDVLASEAFQILHALVHADLIEDP